jgi:hypothetical protein
MVAALLSPCVQAHPGHEHQPGALAGFIHSITEWGPLLALLVLMVATGYSLWKALS